MEYQNPFLSTATWECVSSSNPGLRSGDRHVSDNYQSLANDRTCAVSEASLVRLALNALQGVRSSLCSIEQFSVCFCSEPADRTYGVVGLWNRSSSTCALGKIFNSIGCLGTLVLLLHKFAGHFTDVTSRQCSLVKEECSSHGLVNQAFAVAIRKVLEGYICSLDTLHASVCFRRSSKSISSFHKLSCLTSIVHFEATLLEVYLHTRQLSSQIETLGNICNLYKLALSFSTMSLDDLIAKGTLEISNFFRGANLLSYLYKQLQVADPAHHALLKFLFFRSCEPYYGFIRSWIFNAEINDPFHEFILEYSKPVLPHPSSIGVIPDDLLLGGIRDGIALPCFLKDVEIPIVRAGQQLQVVKKLFESHSFVFPHDHTWDDFLPSLGDFVGDNFCFASLLTSSNGDLDSMASSRSNYYQKMQEKLDDLLPKLKLRYDEVVRFGFFQRFDNCGMSSNPERSFIVEERINHFATPEMSYNERDVDNSPSTSESDVCSSEAYEDHIEKPPVKNEENYLSSLKFFMNNSIGDPLKKTHCPECPVLSDQGIHGSNVEFSNDSMLCFRNEACPSDGCVEKHALNRDLKKEGKVNYCSDFLSAKPFTRKKHVSCLRSNLLHFYDFSSVQDPHQMFLEKLYSVDVGHDMKSLGSTPVISKDFSGQSVDGGERGIGGDDRLAVNVNVDYGLSHLSLKEDDGVASVSVNVNGGSSWESLLGGFISIKHENDEDHNHGDMLLTTVDMPLDLVIQKLLLLEILLQYKYVSSLAIKLLEVFHCQEHLLALRRYFFMEISDWAELFILSIWHNEQKWCVPETDKGIYAIQGFLESSFQKSSCEHDVYKDRLFLYIKQNHKMPHSAAIIGLHTFDFLGLGYHIDWPVSIILTSNALELYAEIFSFLVQLKLAKFALTDIWCSLKGLMRVINGNSHSSVADVMCINMLMKMRHFISALEHYVQSQLSYVSWGGLLQSLMFEVKDLMDFELVHMAYIKNALHVCFLSDETQEMHDIISKLLQCALDFRSCICGRLLDVEFDQGALFGNAYGLDMSQVFSLKERFELGLGELRRCYLSPPKQKEFGLAWFWTLLHFNDYYRNDC